MVNPVPAFLRQLRIFSKKNGWVFVVFAIGLTVIAVTDRGNPLGIATMFSLHFIADIFVMMMVFEYSQKNYRAGTIYQVFSTSLFFGITFYTGLSEHHWQYFPPDIVFALSAFKNYFKDVRHRDIRWINYKTMSVLSLLIYAGTYQLGWISRGSQGVQMAGIFLFAIALSTAGNERLRYILSIVGMFGMVFGSVGELVATFLDHNVVGLALSFSLLPLTVLIVYLRLWRSFLGYGK